MMLEDFREVLKEYYNIEHVELSSNFRKDFGLSSFEFVNLICIIEEKYKIDMEIEDYYNLNTIGDLISYIESKKA